MQSRSHQQRSSRDGTSRRGFASMDPDEQREIASRGGRARHRGPRGFAAMDPKEQREIASRGGRASHGGRGRNYYNDDSYSSSRSTRGSSRRNARGVGSRLGGSKSRMSSRYGVDYDNYSTSRRGDDYNDYYGTSRRTSGRTSARGATRGSSSRSGRRTSSRTGRSSRH